MSKGLIFDIQHFSLHDGPGIRTTVFFKGCSLHCAWCHNPESIDIRNQLYFEERKCISCGACALVCENGVHSFEGGIHRVDFSKCVLCGKCIDACMPGALRQTARYYDADELMAGLIRDRSLYRRSGGGVTFSGGEPLLQAKFIREVAEKLKKEDIHICIDTALNVKKDTIVEIIDFTDLFLCDIKAISKDIFRKYIGDDNSLILDNLKYISKRKDMYIRIPVIGGVNDDISELEKIRDVIEDLGPSVREVGILTYHDLGVEKAKKVGRNEDPFEIRNEAEYEWIKDFFKGRGYRLLFDGNEVR